MSNKVTEGIQSSSLAFLNLQRKQNVSKSKLEEEFVQRAWNTCSAGFAGNNVEQSKKKFHFKSENIGTTDGNLCFDQRNLETLHNRLTGSDYRSVKRKSMLEIGNIDTHFFQPPPKSSSHDTQLLNSTQFLLCLKKAENGHKEKRKPDSLSVTKKQSNIVQNIENPFQKDNDIVKLPIKVCSEFHTASICDIFPEQSIEQETALKKRKVPDGIFINPSLNFLPLCSVKEVLRKTIVPSIHHDSNSLAERAHIKRLHDSASSTRIYQSKDEIDKDTSSLLFHSSAKSSPSGLNASKVYLNNSLTSKGSNWIQSLQLTLSEEGESDNQDRSKKRKLRNVLQGGYAEQLLKLQRREQSEKIIWEHKMDRNKEKAVKTAICMAIIAITHAHNIVIAKCTCYNFPFSRNVENTKMCNSEELNNKLLSIAFLHDILMDTEEVSKQFQSKLFLVLFKKSHFYQLHLKVKDVFQLYPPWQILKSSTCTVILCTHFVEHIPQLSENNIIGEEIPDNTGHKNISSPVSAELSSISVIKLSQSSMSLVKLFFKWGEFISLYGRVQRIWHHQVYLPESFPNYTKHHRLSLLLQEQEGIFYEVIFTTQSSAIGPWLHFLSTAEGKCFGFHNLRLTHRLPLKKHKPLRNYLEAFVQGIGEQGLNQEFYYQLRFDTSCKTPKEVSSESYPPYYQAQVEPMSKLLEESSVSRFSFIGNILHEHKNVFYVSDESLMHKPLTKYFQLHLSYSFETKSLIMGSPVFIREALFSKSTGHLVLDKYSNITVFSESCIIPQNLLVDNLKQLPSVKLQSIVMPLSIDCKVSDLVSITGLIVSVDESSAFSFLQCCFCLQENLVQDTNLVIYCEDCSQIVPKPILKIKMEVSISCQGLESVSVYVQLLSSTIKNILQINDDVHQPHCSVADVLGKNVGPIVCYIKSCDSTGNQQTFHLSEILSS